MRILFALTYYRPHISGLTIHVQRIAEGLAARGHEVTVLTSRYDAALPTEAVHGGVRIRRVPVWWRVDKGVLTPTQAVALDREIRRHEIVALSLPANPDLVWLARRLARRRRRPLLAVYACDARFGPGVGRQLLERICRAIFARALAEADAVLVLSEDYARHTPALAPARTRVRALSAPIRMPAVSRAAAQAFRERHGLTGPEARVLLAARLAAEKGVEHLIEALVRLGRVGRACRLVITGDQDRVIGERAYRERLDAQLRALDPAPLLTGELDADEMAACFAACDVTVLPSDNETESFGMVQVESMLCGTPVVATDLPGVREPVLRTGMGRIVPPRDAAALADALAAVLDQRAAYLRPRAAIEAAYPHDDAIGRHERLVAELVGAQRAADAEQTGRLAEFREQAREVPAFRALVRSIEARLLRAAGPFAAPSLDLGCGDGHFAQALGARFDAGLDRDPQALAEARARDRHATLVCADARALPFETRSLQTVVANSALEHMRDLPLVLDELARVLRPGGRLLLTAPSDRFGSMLAVPGWCRRLALPGVAARYADWFDRRSQHRTTWSPETWAQSLAARSFEVRAWRYYGSPRSHRLFDVLHYLGIPNAISRRLTGRWVAAPLQPSVPLFARLAREALRETPPRRAGPYVFFVAERRP